MSKKTIHKFLQKQLDEKREKKKIKNNGFEKIRIATLKYELGSCSKIIHNRRKHYTIRELGFNKLHELCNKGEKRWKEYFNNGGKVYIKTRSTNESMCDRILFDKNVKKYIGDNIPLPTKIKPITKKNKKNGKFGKVKGFDYYLRSEKLFPKQRKTLLANSEDYIGNIIHEQSKLRGGIDKVDKDLVYLDSEFDDLELIEQWNNIFDKYGFAIPEFHDKWVRMFGTNTRSKKDKNDIEKDEINNPELAKIKSRISSIVNKKMPNIKF
jgi:hypothetical protein